MKINILITTQMPDMLLKVGGGLGGRGGTGFFVWDNIYLKHRLEEEDEAVRLAAAAWN